MNQTSIYHRRPGGQTCKPLIVSAYILEKAVQNLKATGHIIVRVYERRTTKPEATRYLIKEYRGAVLYTNLTKEQATGLLPQIKTWKRLVIAEDRVVKRQGPTMILNRSAVTRKRKAMGLTKKELGIKSGLTLNYLSYMDRKAINPRANTIRKLAVGLECKVEEICWTR